MYVCAFLLAICRIVSASDAVLCSVLKPKHMGYIQTHRKKKKKKRKSSIHIYIYYNKIGKKYKLSISYNN